MLLLHDIKKEFKYLKRSSLYEKIYKVQDQDEYMSEILIKIPDEKKEKITLFLKKNKIKFFEMKDLKREKTKPVDLKRLSGITSVGGDALEDTERFYS